MEQANPNRHADPSEENRTSSSRVRAGFPEPRNRPSWPMRKLCWPSIRERARGVEEVLRWIRRQGGLNPEAELEQSLTYVGWKYVSAECDRYYAKAVESGNGRPLRDWN